MNYFLITANVLKGQGQAEFARLLESTALGKDISVMQIQADTLKGLDQVLKQRSNSNWMICQCVFQLCRWRMFLICRVYWERMVYSQGRNRATKSRSNHFASGDMDILLDPKEIESEGCHVVVVIISSL